MNQVYIVVEDGLVQTVYSTDPNTEVILCDLDTFEAEEKKATEACIAIARAVCHQVY